MATWADLREMREQGLRPSLPVIVTVDGKRPAGVLAEQGCLVIRHKPGEVFHVELLAGLRVWLFLGSCDRAQAVLAAMKSKAVHIAELRAWCPCEQRLDPAPTGCELAREWRAAA